MSKVSHSLGRYLWRIVGIRNFSNILFILIKKKKKKNTLFSLMNLIILCSTCFEQPSVYLQEDMYMQFYGTFLCWNYNYNNNNNNNNNNRLYFYVLLTMHLSIIFVNNQLDAQFFSCMFISILYMFRALFSVYLHTKQSSIQSDMPDVVLIQLILLMMGTWLPETCRE
jgi:hypothetical protein